MGLILTVWRILRCNPFCKGGYDPVPERGLRNPPEIRNMLCRTRCADTKDHCDGDVTHNGDHPSCDGESKEKN